MKKIRILISGACLLASLPSLMGQGSPVPLAATGLVSPEVHPDRTVTFRIEAPKASKVEIAGEWLFSNRAEATVNGSAMIKGDKGVWSATVGPLEPNTYIYSFNVDGMNIADPVNPSIKLRARTSASLVTILGDQPWEFRDVPHGAVEINYHKSAILKGAARQVFVYTPPGYGKNVSTRYPVLYLLHGSGGVASDWTNAGFANYIEDNLLADKKCVPMIIVMPWGHALPMGAATGDNTSLFEQYLLKEAIPMVESKYRVAPGRAYRAIAGLSMGGGESTLIGLGHPELFAHVGLFSHDMGADSVKYKVLNDPKAAAEMRTLFWGVGKEDPSDPGMKKLTDSLTSLGIKHVFYEDTEGATGHVWPVWRKCLTQFAPLLFQNNSGHGM
jgi:enterochelin esterase-like enzyme